MTDFEMAEAERFAQALEAIEALAEPDLDPREDPTLFSLAALAAEIHDAEQAATNSASFRSYCERSRTYVLNRLGARQAAQRVDDRAARDDGQPFFIFRWNVLAPIASAAASAVLVLAFVVMQSDGTPAQTVAAVAPAVEQPAPDQVTIPAPRAEEAEPARAAVVQSSPSRPHGRLWLRRLAWETWSGRSSTSSSGSLAEARWGRRSRRRSISVRSSRATRSTTPRG